jgi:copper chaperone NosL
MRRNNIFTLLSLILISMVTISCSQEPAEIHYASDECAHCKMMITDNHFAAQIVTKKGKAIKFDAVECMAGYAKAYKEDLKEAKFWVSDYSNPGQWLSLEQARFVQSEVVKSPMGAFLLALPGEEQMHTHLLDKPGKEITWQQILEIEMNKGMSMPSHKMNNH